MMSPSPVVRELAAPRRGAIAPAAGQTQSETRSSMGPVGQVKKGHMDKQRHTKRQTTVNNRHTRHRRPGTARDLPTR